MSYDQWKLATPPEYEGEDPEDERRKDELEECDAIEDLEERCGMVGEPDEFAGKVRFNNDKKYDLQLSQGLLAERRLAGLLCNATFDTLEVKKEEWLWERTGNIFIEFESRGKPSGIAATEAHIWVHTLLRDDRTLLQLWVPMDRLRELCARAPVCNRGGDGKAQKGYLLKLTDLLR